MKPPEEAKGELVRGWLAKAEADFIVARRLVAEGAPYLDAVCFHAQQAAEKYLKAFLVQHQVEFPKTHNLGELLDLISRADGHLAGSLSGVTALNPYGVDIRYPSDFPQVNEAEAEKAVGLADAVRKAILTTLTQHLGD